MKKVRFEEKSKLRAKFKDSSIFNKGNVYYDGMINGKCKISAVIAMLTIKGSSNYNKENEKYEGILHEKK